MPCGVCASSICIFTDASTGKAIDFDVRGTKIDRSRACIETKAHHVLVVKRVIKVLQKVIHAKKKLVRQPKCECAVQNSRPVLLAAGHGLEIFRVNRTAESGGVSASHKTPDGQALCTTKCIVHSGNTVVAERSVIGTSAKVVCRRWGTPDRTRPQIA